MIATEHSDTAQNKNYAYWKTNEWIIPKLSLSLCRIPTEVRQGHYMLWLFPPPSLVRTLKYHLVFGKQKAHFSEPHFLAFLKE